MEIRDEYVGYPPCSSWSSDDSRDGQEGSMARWERLPGGLGRPTTAGRAKGTRSQRPFTELSIVLGASRIFPAHQRIVLRVLDAPERKVNVELGPAEMAWGRSLDARDLCNGGVPEPGEGVKRKEVLLAIHKQPEPVLGDVCQLNSRNARSRPRGFHLLVP